VIGHKHNFGKIHRVELLKTTCWCQNDSFAEGKLKIFCDKTDKFFR